MTVNVVVQIGGKIGGQVVRHAVEVLEHLKQRRRLIVHWLDPHESVPEAHGRSFGNLMTPFSTTGVMLIPQTVASGRATVERALED